MTKIENDIVTTGFSKRLDNLVVLRNHSRKNIDSKTSRKDEQKQGKASGKLLALFLCVSMVFALHIPAAAQVRDLQKVLDAALVPPVINTSPLPEYDYDRLDYGMTIGIERTPKGRIWACWVGGGDNPEAFFVLATSDNNGKTWSKPKVVIDPHDSRIGDNRCVLVGNLWLDPLGRLWLFFSQSMSNFDGRAGDWYTMCENPDSDNPVWSNPVRIWHGCTLNKPTVLQDGTWLLPISLWHRGVITKAYRESFYELDPLRMANVFASTDQGKTWVRRGGACFPKPEYDEHHVIQRKDGSLWMTARTSDGIWESTSTDNGFTWSSPNKYMVHVNSRHFIRRLQSGRLLLVRHGKIDQRTKARSQLSAYLSEDDGKTWIGGLMLDERRGISYPDGFQSPDGTIYVSYDHLRGDEGEILMARFTEKDIMAGKFVARKSRPKMLISRPLGIEIHREY